MEVVMKRFLILSLFLFSLGFSGLVYSADADSADRDCAVCLEPLGSYEDSADFDAITTLPTRQINGHNVCGHSFHTQCLLSAAERGFNCPKCRTPYDSSLIPSLPQTTLNLEEFSIQVQDSELDLVGRQITTLRGLQHVQHSGQVQSIDARQNLITQVPAGVFSAFPRLEELYFDDNQSLVSFENRTVFDQCLTLKELSFKNCRLTEIPAGAFDQLQNLEYLNISDNPIASFPVGLFSQLVALEDLDLVGLQMTDDEKERIRQEVIAVAPQCSILFVDQTLESSLDDFFDDDADDDDQGDNEGNDSDGGSDDGDGNLADISLLSYEEEPGQ